MVAWGDFRILVTAVCWRPGDRRLVLVVAKAVADPNLAT